MIETSSDSYSPAIYKASRALVWLSAFSTNYPDHGYQDRKHYHIVFYYFLMAHCPTCGSDHIQLKKDSNVSWGRAIAGWALFGVVGGAVGAVTGDNKDSNSCLNCGTSWKAKDLYKILEIIKSSIGFPLNLMLDSHRTFLKNFMEEIGPLLEQLSKFDEKVAKDISKIKSKDSENTAQGCSYGCFIAVGLIFAIGAVAPALALLALIILPIVGLYMGNKLDQGNKPKIEQKSEALKEDSNKERQIIESDIEARIAEFISRNPISLNC